MSREDADALAGRVDAALLAVLALALTALALRLVGLGSRPFHWEEARVGYWTLRYLETGAFQYRPVAGGPLLYHVDRAFFAVFGASEFVARLPVALSGAAFPLVALLFRDRLDDAETVVFAAILAFQPLVLYYSRFLRGDVPLALFGLAFVGFALRAWDRRSRRDAYAAAIALPLAWSASGFVVGYLCCWLAAWLLVVDQRSVVADAGEGVRAAVASLRSRLAGTSTPAARAFLLATGVTAALFAPRSGPGVEVGLDDPTTLHLAVYEGTVGALRRFVGVRVVNRFPEGTHAFLPHLRDAGDLLFGLALPVVVLGAGATLWARYARTQRPLVEGVGYWGLLAVVAFPTIAEVSAPWTLVHVVVPLSLPAAVGLVAVVRWGMEVAGGDTNDNAGRGSASAASARVDTGTVVALALVVLAVVAQAGSVAATGVYGPSDRDNELAQFAQPSDDLTPFASAVRAVAADDPATAEVLYVGSAYHVPDGDDRQPPVSDAWGNRLPLPWYVETAGADATSVSNVSAVDSTAANASLPPIVVSEPSHQDALADRLGSNYAATTYRLGLWNREVVVFVADTNRPHDGSAAGADRVAGRSGTTNL